MRGPTVMELVVGSDGGVKCIYDETLDLRALGRLQITRASHVEPDRDGQPTLFLTVGFLCFPIESCGCCGRPSRDRHHAGGDSPSTAGRRRWWRRGGGW